MPFLPCSPLPKAARNYFNLIGAPKQAASSKEPHPLPIRSLPPVLLPHSNPQEPQSSRRTKLQQRSNPTPHNFAATNIQPATSANIVAQFNHIYIIVTTLTIYCLGLLSARFVMKHHQRARFH